MRPPKVAKIQRRSWTENYGKDWQAQKEQHKQAIGLRCDICKTLGDKENPVQRHHVIGSAKGAPNTPNYLQPLCKRCHEIHHQRGRLR